MVPTMKRLLCLAVVVTAQAAVADRCQAQSKARAPSSKARPSSQPAPSYRKAAPYMVVEHDVFDRTDWTPKPAPVRHDYYGDMKAGLHTNKSVPSLNRSRMSRMPGYGGMSRGGMYGGMYGSSGGSAHHAGAPSPYSSSLIRPFR